VDSLEELLVALQVLAGVQRHKGGGGVGVGRAVVKHVG